MTNGNGDDVSQSQLSNFTQVCGGKTITFSNVVQFGPRGDATLGNSSTAHRIQIGLQPLRGSNANDPNVAAIQIGKLTGQVKVYRK